MWNIHTSGFLGLEEKLLWLGTICRRQPIVLEILYCSVSHRIDSRTMVQDKEVTNGQRLYSRFGNFRWYRPNEHTGKLFTSLRFFRKVTPNYLYIALKRSPSFLTLGQCKFDIRSMSKTSKLCQIVYHSTRLYGAKLFKLLCGYSGSKYNYHKQNQRSRWKR